MQYFGWMQIFKYIKIVQLLVRWGEMVAVLEFLEIVYPSSN